MKFLSALLICLSLTPFTQAQASNACDDQVISVINKLGPASDVPYRIDPAPTYLSAGEELKDFYGNVIKTYKNDKLLYSFSGSYHSGWFEEVAVVNPKNCWVIEFVNIYSE